MLRPCRQIAVGGRRSGRDRREFAVDVLQAARHGRTCGRRRSRARPDGPASGYGSWPTISTRTSVEGRRNARRTFSPAGRYSVLAAPSARRKSPIAEICPATGRGRRPSRPRRRRQAHRRHRTAYDSSSSRDSRAARSRHLAVERQRPTRERRRSSRACGSRATRPRRRR